MAAPLRVAPLGRALPRGDRVVNVSTFAFLFSELVSYYQGRIANMSELETRLESAGYSVGLRYVELAALRDKSGGSKRETTVVGMLQFISGPAWESLFGRRVADGALQKSVDTPRTYMIREDVPVTNAFISIPKDYGSLNVAAYVAGIVRGMMEAASFPCTVRAVTEATTEGPRDKTVFLITLDESVALREAIA